MNSIWKRIITNNETAKHQQTIVHLNKKLSYKTNSGILPFDLNLNIEGKEKLDRNII